MKDTVIIRNILITVTLQGNLFGSDSHFTFNCTLFQRLIYKIYVS